MESLRGIAAVAVVGYHACAQRFETLVTGMAPVVMFFVLSGFVLARSPQNDPDSLVFFRNRFFRLIPPATAVVLSLSALYGLTGFSLYQPPSGLLNIILNALLIQTNINPIMWSLTVEAFATPLILLSFAAFHRYGSRALFAIGLPLIGISSWGPYVHLLGYFTNLAPLYAFVAGVFLHFETMRAQEYRFVASTSIFAAIVLCAAGLRKQTAITFFLECVGSGALIFLIANFNKQLLFRPLDLPIIRFYGQISYSFYLWHVVGIVLGVKTLALAPQMSPAAGFVAIFVMAVVYTTPMAWLSYVMIERPFVRLGRSGFSFLGRQSAQKRPAT